MINDVLYKEETEEVNRLLKHFNPNIASAVDNFVKNIVFKYKQYLFVEKRVKELREPLTNKKQKENHYFYYCTSCKHEGEIEEDDINLYKHNERVICPCCGNEVVVKHTKYRRGTLMDRAVFITYEKSIIDKETIVATGYFVKNDYSGDYKKAQTEYKEITKYVFEPGKSTMLSNWTTWCGGGWTIRKKCYGWADGINYESYVDKESIERAVKDTRFKYSPYKRYLNRYKKESMISFFYQFNRYPIIEQLVKVGFVDIADRLVYGMSLENSVKFKEKDVFKFLKINRAEAKEILESGVRCTPSFLNVFRISKDLKLKWSIERIEVIAKEVNGKLLKKINQYAGINKTLNYLDRQCEILKKDNYYFQYMGETIKYWLDYLNDCKDLDMDLKSKHVLYPKNLYIAHQSTIKQVEYKKDEILDKKIIKLAKSREKYKFKYKNLLIRPCMSTEELINEGKMLNHCVGRYAKDYANGKTNILFIRKITEEDKPLYTMEVTKGKVAQCRGKNNCALNAEGQEFVKEFKKKVLKIKA